VSASIEPREVNLVGRTGSTVRLLAPDSVAGFCPGEIKPLFLNSIAAGLFWRRSHVRGEAWPLRSRRQLRKAFKRAGTAGAGVRNHA
jgi:hypothetical protein